MTVQLQLINKILNTQDFSIISKNDLTDDLFFNYKAEFNYIKNHFKKYQVVPDKLTFLEVFPDFDCLEVNESLDYLLEQLYKSYNTSYLATSFNEMKKLLESDRVDDALQYYLTATKNIKASATKSCVNLMSDFGRYDRYLERINNPNNFYISTGFPELDALIGGIDRENENMVIAARTGIGKSWTLIKMAVEASKLGLTVGFYSGEMSADKVGYRVDTLLGNINNKAITRGLKDTDVELNYRKYINSLKDKNYGPINVLTPADIAGPATVDALKSFVEREKLDILFVDQYSLLEDASKAKAMHEKVANISKEIKNLQVLYKIPVISVSQMNRTKNEDKDGNNIQDTTQIGLSDRIGQDATVVLMLSREGDDGERLVLNVVKSRDGGDNKKLTYISDFNNGIFTYINEKADEEYSEATKSENAAIASRYGDF